MTTSTTAPQDAPISEDARRSILESAGLFARAPSSFPGLSMQMDPSRGLDPSFRPVAYDTRHTTGEMVHCSICAQRQEHFDGAIVRVMDGNVGLVGNDCGKRHFFGEDGWTAITNRLRQDSEQAIFMARFGTAKERIDAIGEMLTTWAARLRQVNLVRARFQAQLPHLFSAVRQQGHSGALHVDQEQQVPFRRANGNIEMRTEVHRVAVCRIDATWFFRGDDLAAAVEQSRSRLIQAGGFLHADAKPHNVSAVKKMIRECRRALETVADQQVQLRSLTSEATLRNLVGWANVSLGGKDAYRSAGRRVERERNDIGQGDLDLSAIPTDLHSAWESVRSSWPSL